MFECITFWCLGGLSGKTHMKQHDLKDRTLEFSVKVIKFTESLPTNQSVQIISKQLLRSSSSVGANYRAARRSKSLRDFINKLKIVEEESDETLYWLQLLVKTKLVDSDSINSLIKEADELVAIFVTSINTAKANLERHQKIKK